MKIKKNLVAATAAVLAAGMALAGCRFQQRRQR